MDPIIGGLIIGGVINQYRINRKYRKAADISARAVERVAEAELQFEEHEKRTELALNHLMTRTEGIIDILQGPFYELFKPFEGADGALRKDLLEDLDHGTLQNLKAIRHIQNIPQIKQLPAHKKLSGTSAAATFLLFGRGHEASRQLDTASAQSEKSKLIAAHIDTLCTALDMQREGYMRVFKTLGALNIALLTSIGRYQEYFQNISWLIDSSTGRFPDSISAREISTAITQEGENQLKNCVNIARCMYAIIERPVFDEKSEITDAANKALREGEEALHKIQMIEQRRR